MVRHDSKHFCTIAALTTTLRSSTIITTSILQIIKNESQKEGTCPKSHFSQDLNPGSVAPEKNKLQDGEGRRYRICISTVQQNFLGL